MEKQKIISALILGIGLGAIFVMILIYGMGAVPTMIHVGFVDLALPTFTPMTYVMPPVQDTISPKTDNTKAIAIPTLPSTNIPTVQAKLTEAIKISTPIPSETPIPPTKTPSATPTPITREIPLWAIAEEGVIIKIPTSGVYKVAYLGDAYSPWSNPQSEGYRGWTTIVRIYVNHGIEWGRTDYGYISPINYTDHLSRGGYYLDKNQAISSSKGDSRTFRLSAGDYLSLVVLDEKGRYGDNQGKVDIEITYLGQ